MWSVPPEQPAATMATHTATNNVVMCICVFSSFVNSSFWSHVLRTYQADVDTYGDPRQGEVT
jgi:hypothetical protein